MKILLIGKTGQLGSDLWEQAKARNEVIAWGKADLDLENLSTISSRVASLNPDVVVNTAAYVDVIRSEEEYEKAFRVNCFAVRELAKACRTFGGRLFTFSTDYVFDGKSRVPYEENAPTHALQMYGISKLAGEQVALSTWEKTFVIRSCGLYGARGSRAKGGNFVDNRLRDAKAQRSLSMAADQIVCPTSTLTLAQASLQLIEHPKASPGVYHLVNEGECSWYEFTREIFALSGFSSTLLTPVNRSGEFGGLQRPVYSVLANQKAAALGIRLPHWREALQVYLSSKLSEGAQ